MWMYRRISLRLWKKCKGLSVHTRSSARTATAETEFKLFKFILQSLPQKSQCLCQCLLLHFSHYLGSCTWGIATCVTYLWGKGLDWCPVSSKAMAAQVVAAISLCCDPHGSEQTIHLELCMTLTPKEEPSECPQRLVIMTLLISGRAPGAVAEPAWQRSCGTRAQPAIRQGKLVAYFAFFSHPISGMILVLVQTVAWLTSFLERFQSAMMRMGAESERSPSASKAVV